MNDAERAVGAAQESINAIFAKWGQLAKQMTERGGGLNAHTAVADIREEIAVVMERLRSSIANTGIRYGHDEPHIH